MESNAERLDLSQVEAGMDLCSSDFKKWGEISEVRRSADGAPAFVIGTVETSGQRVYVPVEEVVELHGRCLRLTHELANLDGAGFGRRPPELA